MAGSTLWIIPENSFNFQRDPLHIFNFIQQVVTLKMKQVHYLTLLLINFLTDTFTNLVPMESEDWGMVALIGVFGFLLCIGTVADCLLNIFKLDILPEKFNQIFQGFSIYNNSLRLFNTKSSATDSLSCINGIRILSLSWVVIGIIWRYFWKTNRMTILYVMCTNNLNWKLLAHLVLTYVKGISKWVHKALFRQ